MKKLQKICGLLVAITMLMGATAVFADGFADVAETDYFYDAVNWGVEKGITYGIDESNFAPNGEVTRAQAVTFLWRMAGEPTATATETFSDVEAGSWYEPAVSWAIETGITEGTGEGKFSPYTICDRAMCITFIYRFMNSPFDGMDLTAEVTIDENSTLEDLGFSIVKQLVQGIREQGLFADVPEESYFEYPVFWGIFNGIITEENSNITAENALFRGTDPCVRGEMISFLYQTQLRLDAENAPIETYFGENVLPVPQEYFDQLYFNFYGGDEDEEEELMMVVQEGESVAAAIAMDEDDTEGVGEIFRIVRVSENRLKEMQKEDMSGIRVFAKDDNGSYYLFCTPTDVRYVRETTEKMEEDIDKWTALNEWANGSLCDDIIEANDNLTAVEID